MNELWRDFSNTTKNTGGAVTAGELCLSSTYRQQEMGTLLLNVHCPPMGHLRLLLRHLGVVWGIDYDIFEAIVTLSNHPAS
jgi:hypothetical protein